MLNGVKDEPPETATIGNWVNVDHVVLDGVWDCRSHSRRSLSRNADSRTTASYPHPTATHPDRRAQARGDCGPRGARGRWTAHRGRGPRLHPA
jgi:hypothetical protein